MWETRKNLPQVEDTVKNSAAAIASGFPLIVTAADKRARAVYYSFTLLCVGLLVLLIVVLVESHKWRNTIQTESQVNRQETKPLSTV